MVQQSRSRWTTDRSNAVAIVALVASALLLTACGGTEVTPSGGSAAPGVKLPQSAAPGPAGAHQRTSIADASVQDISAALEANGVPDAQHWSKVVMDNGPYAREDANQTRLRSVLQRYGADGPTVDKITNALVA
jgi:hypothetical protein